MAHKGTRVVVFCDLDSLLMQDPLAGPDAGREIADFDADGVALVLCSRRTRAEIDWFAQQLGIRGPMVAENGGAVFMPAGTFGHVVGSRPVAGYDAVEFGWPRRTVFDRLRRAATAVGAPVRALSDLEIDDAAEMLGLPVPLARLAMLREYTEVCQVDAVHRTPLADALHALHLHCIEEDGVHYVSSTVDTSLGVALLRGLYRRVADAAVTVGIADAASDPDLLRLVDHPVTVAADAAHALVLPPALTHGGGRTGSTSGAAMVDIVTGIAAAVRRVGVRLRLGGGPFASSASGGS